jgi:hypothetical protein
LITITGVNLTVAAGAIAAIGDIYRFSSLQKLVSYFGLSPRRGSASPGLVLPIMVGLAKRGGARPARCWLRRCGPRKARGPLHAFFVRIRAKRGPHVAGRALARKLTVLCWHLRTKETDYRWARPALVATPRRPMEFLSARAQKKGNRRDPAYAQNVKALRDQ